MQNLNEPKEIEHTRRWISSVVIGLNLCPFADRVFQSDSIRYRLTETSDASELLTTLASELQFLVASSRDQIETTILIHPHTLHDFLDYNDFLGVAEELVNDLGYQGVIQVVGFHPKYQFAGAGPEDAQNYTNRSPYPMLHLLREESVSEVVKSDTDGEEISQRNIKTLDDLGVEKILEKLKACLT